MYGMAVTTLLSIEIFQGAATRDAIIVNRIVATCTGVFMACVVAVIPPFVKGGSPDHTLECLTTMKVSFNSLLKTYADKEEWSAITQKDAMEKFIHPVQLKHECADFLLKDADMFDSLIGMCFPNLTVKAGLKPLLADMQVSITLMKKVVDYLCAIEGEEAVVLRTAISDMLSTGWDRFLEEGATRDADNQKRQLQGRVRLSIRLINARWQEHQVAWDAIDDAASMTVKLARKLDAMQQKQNELVKELAAMKENVTVTNHPDGGTPIHHIHDENKMSILLV